MNQIHTLFQNLPQEKLPREVHVRLVERIMCRQLLTPVWVGLTVFGISFIGLLAHTWSRLVDGEVLFIVRGLLGDFEISLDYLKDLWSALPDHLPIFSLVTLLCNAVLLAIFFVYFARVRRTIGIQSRPLSLA